MTTRLTFAVIVAALALTACDQASPKPKSAGAATGGAAAGPRIANGAQANPNQANPAQGTPSAQKPDAARPDTTRPVTISTPKTTAGVPETKTAAPAPAAAPPATPTAPGATPPASTDAPKDSVLKHTETDSGLIIDDLKFGTGVEAQPHQTVTINYRGTLADGTEFASSYKTGKAETFALDSLVKGWQEGIPGMKIGGKRRLIVPPDLGWGKKVVNGPDGKVLVPANSMVIFEVELVGAQ